MNKLISNYWCYELATVINFLNWKKIPFDLNITKNLAIRGNLLEGVYLITPKNIYLKGFDEIYREINDL